MHSILMQKFIETLAQKVGEGNCIVVGNTQDKITIHCRHKSYTTEAWQCLRGVYAARLLAFESHQEPMMTIRYGIQL